MKNHGLSKNVMFLLYSNCTMCERWLISLNKVVPLSYQLFALLSQISHFCVLGFLPLIQLHVPLTIWGIWLSISIKSSFLYFGPLHSCDVIYWVKDRDCANEALGPVGRWPCHCLGNKSWILRGTSRALWLLHVSLMWSNMHSTNKECPYSFWS